MILVWWGDWRMLKAMRELHIYNKPFFWVNCGTLGFLTNRECHTCMSSLTSEELEYVTVSPIEVEIQTKNKWKKTGVCRNDLVVWGHILDYNTYQVDLADEQNKLSFQGTWLVISTALWSTAYAANLWTPIMPLESNLWSLSGIASWDLGYRFVKQQEISIEVSSRSPMSVWLDGYNEVIYEPKSIIVRPTQATAQLVFLWSEHFNERRLLLAEEKLGK